MGLFSWVEIDKSLLPEKYQNFIDWQTKNIIEPSMETLEITIDKKLIHHWNTIKPYKGTEKDCFGIIPAFEIDQEFHNELYITGEMNFYTIKKNKKEETIWIDGYAKFVNGKLIDLKFHERKI